MKRSAAAL